MAGGEGGLRIVQYFLDPRIPSSRRQVIPLASAMTSQEWHVEKPPCVNGTEPLAISLSWLSKFLGCSDKHRISQATVSHRICFKGHERQKLNWNHEVPGIQHYIRGQGALFLPGPAFLFLCVSASRHWLVFSQRCLLSRSGGKPRLADFSRDVTLAGRSHVRPWLGCGRDLSSGGVALSHSHCWLNSLYFANGLFLFVCLLLQRLLGK